MGEGLPYVHEALASTPSGTSKKIYSLVVEFCPRLQVQFLVLQTENNNSDKNPTNNVLSPPIKPPLTYTTTARKLLLQ